jgi:hypothetical protein
MRWACAVLSPNRSNCNFLRDDRKCVSKIIRQASGTEVMNKWAGDITQSNQVRQKCSPSGLYFIVRASNRMGLLCTYLFFELVAKLSVHSIFAGQQHVKSPVDEQFQLCVASGNQKVCSRSFAGLVFDMMIL